VRGDRQVGGKDGRWEGEQVGVKAGGRASKCKGSKCEGRGTWEAITVARQVSARPGPYMLPHAFLLIILIPYFIISSEA
jgi:hypothetical protein